MRALLLITGAAAIIAAAPAQPPLLTAQDLDPALVLPPPPAPGSPQAQAELAELRAIHAVRTPDMLARAQHEADTKDASVFAEAIGPGFQLDRLPATARLMDEVRAAEKDSADRAKAHFRRNRPWVTNPDIQHCSDGGEADADWTSYPSGHTTMGYSMGAILARLAPARAGAIMARAAAYGQSRIVCQVHFRSDVTGGQVLGLIVAERLMTKPQFVADFAAAKAELHAAKVID